jgi:hypothetical protein
MKKIEFSDAFSGVAVVGFSRCHNSSKVTNIERRGYAFDKCSAFRD